MTRRQIIAAVDLVALVGESIPLRRVGTQLTRRGLCPFHDDERETFRVFPTTQRWGCPECRLFGDAIDFVMRYERISEAEALEMLAERIGEPQG